MRFLIFLSLVFCSRLPAAELPSGGESLVPRTALTEFKLTTMGNATGNIVARLVPVENVAGSNRAWQVETRVDSSPAWAGEIRTPLVRAVEKGDVALVRFFARSLASSDESGGGRLRVTVQQAGPNYEKSLETLFTVGREWQEFLVPFSFSRAFSKGSAEVTFGFGFKHQILELRDIEVLGYGKKIAQSALPKTRFSYAGREPDAAWRREALARIEQIRKGDFSLHVTDAAGAPIAGATIRLEQRRSAFQWGSALQFKRLVQDSPENKIYREKVLELFNAASPENDLKWPMWEGDRGTGYEHEQSLTALRWLNEQRFHVRGHVLVWPGWKDLPKSVVDRREKKRQKEIPPLVLAHIREITTATSGLLREWDVLNEPYDHHDLMDIFGNDIMISWFRTAAESAPGLPLYLNDFSNHDMIADADHFKNFYRTVLFLQKSGAPLGGLGLQAHIGTLPNAPENILATLDLYATFKLPIRFTEFDVNTEDEELQADYTRDFLILAFSHPAVVGVQHWGFWEKAHWRPLSAMFRADWSEKPNAGIYRSLVLGQWRTKLAGATDADGRFSVRGFHGEYAIFVEKDGRRAQGSFAHRPGAAKPVIEIKLP